MEMDLKDLKDTFSEFKEEVMDVGSQWYKEFSQLTKSISSEIKGRLVIDKQEPEREAKNTVEGALWVPKLPV